MACTHDISRVLVHSGGGYFFRERGKRKKGRERDMQLLQTKLRLADTLMQVRLPLVDQFDGTTMDPTRKDGYAIAIC